MVTPDANLTKVKVKTDGEEDVIKICGMRTRSRQRKLALASIISLIGTCWFALEVSHYLSSSGRKERFKKTSTKISVG